MKKLNYHEKLEARRKKYFEKNVIKHLDRAIIELDLAKEYDLADKVAKVKWVKYAERFNK